MNLSVLLFFSHNVLATLLLGGKFASRRDPVVRNFGIALLFDAVAFVIWSLAVVLRPDNLEQYVTVGVVFFIASMMFLIIAGTQHISATVQKGLIVLGVVVGAGIFYLRTFAYPAMPSFSPDGFFFFNLHPVVQMFYIFALGLAAFPAIEALAAKFGTSFYSELVRYGFIAEVVGGIMLIASTNITSANTSVLYITGWIIGIVYLVLWTSLLFSSKAWSNVK